MEEKKESKMIMPGPMPPPDMQFPTVTVTVNVEGDRPRKDVVYGVSAAKINTNGDLTLWTNSCANFPSRGYTAGHWLEYEVSDYGCFPMHDGANK